MDSNNPRVLVCCCIFSPIKITHHRSWCINKPKGGLQKRLSGDLKISYRQREQTTKNMKIYQKQHTISPENSLKVEIIVVSELKGFKNVFLKPYQSRCVGNADLTTIMNSLVLTSWRVALAVNQTLYNNRVTWFLFLCKWAGILFEARTFLAPISGFKNP